MYNPDDTICAISTAPGEAALAIVRVSGKRAKDMAGKTFKGGRLLERRATFGRIVDASGASVDQVMLIWYRAPKSYTGEDMVEIICHGGHVVPQEIMSLLCQNGARLAEAGEFTLRAYLNSRIDLTEAEAINSVIRAKTAKAKNMALQNLEGSLKTRLETISAKLLELIIVIEAEIDFSDEEISKLVDGDIIFRLDEIGDLLAKIRATYDIGRIAEGQAQIAIVGAPNVGKSSLFNALLESDRAIVAESPGTTRDYISEYVNIGGYPVMLTDTAGIRATTEGVELLGIDRTLKLIDPESGGVDLCLFLLDSTRRVNDDDRKIAIIIENRPHLTVLNKIDLASGVSDSHHAPDNKPIRVSALTREGLDELVAEMSQSLIGSSSGDGAGIFLSHRQFECAERAARSIYVAKEAVSNGEYREVLACVLREALDHLGEITGRITTDLILESIFSKFCVGK